MLGIVKWFDAKRGYGFILNPNGQDVFVHFASILDEGFRKLREGERVEFESSDGPRGPFARNVKRLPSEPEPASAKPAAATRPSQKNPRESGDSRETRGKPARSARVS